MGRPFKTTPEQIKEMKKLYREGHSSVEIGKKFGLDHTTILFHLGTLKKRPVGWPKGKPRIQESGEIPKDILENLAKQEKPKEKKNKDQRWELTRHNDLDSWNESFLKEHGKWNYYQRS